MKGKGEIMNYGRVAYVIGCGLIMAVFVYVGVDAWQDDDMRDVLFAVGLCSLFLDQLLHGGE